MTARVPMSVLLDAAGNAVGAITFEHGRWIGHDTTGRRLFDTDSEATAADAARTLGQPVSTVHFGLLPATGGEPCSDRVALDRHGLPYVTRPWPMYVTPCCFATVTISTDDGVLCCRSCYADVDPLLSANPDPI